MKQAPPSKASKQRRISGNRWLAANALALAVALTGVPAAALPEATPADSPLLSGTDASENPLPDAQRYLQRIAELEAVGGAYAPGLSEQLLGLGLALQRSGDHDEAIKTFKRGIHLTRINEGLHSDRQMAMLQGEIASHIAQGSLAEADERQRYLYRIQTRALTDTTRARAYMQHAQWQRKAYEADLGENSFMRLINMFGLYRLALTDLVNIEGRESPLLLEPLYAMLRAQYLLSGFVGETSSGSYRTRAMLGDEEKSMQLAYGKTSHKEGNAVIRSIYEVSEVQPDFDQETAAKILLMQADWKLWHGKRDDAEAIYREIFMELASREEDQAIIASLFAEPVPLPTLEGVRTLPPPIAEREGALLLEFDVTARGRVRNLERVDTYPGNDDIADAVMRRFRQTQFRPRISDGMPVETQGLRWAYDASVW